jgi:hypothetical protein
VGSAPRRACDWYLGSHGPTHDGPCAVACKLGTTVLGLYQFFNHSVDEVRLLGDETTALVYIESRGQDVSHKKHTFQSPMIENIKRIMKNISVLQLSVRQD